MNKKVTKIFAESLEFDDGTTISSSHEQDCCESHYLSFEHLSIHDFEGLEFNLDSDNFFTKIANYGISLNPVKGHPIRIPGYGYNNGYYGTNLTLCVSNKNGDIKEFDITECQVINDD